MLKAWFVTACVLTTGSWAQGGDAGMAQRPSSTVDELKIWGGVSLREAFGKRADLKVSWPRYRDDPKGYPWRFFEHEGPIPTFLGVRPNGFTVVMGKKSGWVGGYHLQFPGDAACEELIAATTRAFGEPYEIHRPRWLEWRSKEVDMDLDARNGECVVHVQDVGWRDTEDTFR